CELCCVWERVPGLGAQVPQSPTFSLILPTEQPLLLHSVPACVGLPSDKTGISGSSPAWVRSANAEDVHQRVRPRCLACALPFVFAQLGCEPAPASPRAPRRVLHRRALTSAHLPFPCRK